MTTSKREELHTAVARAIYDGRFWDDCEREVPWAELSDSRRSFFLELAEDAVSVVLAEAKRSMRVCPKCGKRVPVTALAGHLNERHPRQGVVWQGPSHRADA